MLDVAHRVTIFNVRNTHPIHLLLHTGVQLFLNKTERYNIEVLYGTLRASQYGIYSSQVCPLKYYNGVTCCSSDTRQTRKHNLQ